MNEQPDWLPNATDVWQIASKCPVKNGAVVYAARNLYNAITGEINYFANDCNIGQARGMRKGMTQATQSQITKADNKFTLYPNPATNTVNIVSSIAIKQIEIVDLMGRVVVTKANVNNIAVQLNNLQLKTGVYVVKSTLSNNTTITKKLIIE